MQPSTVALIGAGVAVVGTLGGVIIGQAMTRDARHKQWRRDYVRQECRELLGQFSVSLFAFMDWTKSIRLGSNNTQHAVVIEQYDSSVLDLHRKLGSCLLIANEIKTGQIKKRWAEALDRSHGAFKKTISELAWRSFAWFAAEPEHLIVLHDGHEEIARSLAQLL